MTCDSGRHAQRGDAKQAPSERCQSGPKGIAQMTSLQRGDRVLKPCPFCGGAACMFQDGGDHYVECSECANRTTLMLSRDYARDKWNTRQSPEAVTDETALFMALKHGDQDHQDWLKEAIAAHFSGQPVPAPRGSGNKEKLIVELQAQVAALLKVSPR